MKKSATLIIIAIAVGIAGFAVVKLMEQPTSAPAPAPTEDYGFEGWLSELDNLLDVFGGEDEFDLENVEGLGEIT